ncbi:Hypothetical predicted protein, partial [Paramuricea clavata]
MQNESEAEGTNRLQKRKQDQATETVDERARILEILRAVFHTASSNENDQESNEQLSMSVDATDQEHFEHRQCIMCKEAWPTQQNLASEVYICYRCKRDKKSPKKFSAENDMDPGIVPELLRGLTQVEENVNFKDIQSFLNRLPSCVADLPVSIGRRHGAEDKHRDFTVRQHKVLEAVLWLKTNNPFFKNIEIDRDVIQSLPENGIPDELRYVIDENELSVHVENEGPPQDPVMSANASVEELVLGSGSTSFIPMRQRQRKE